MIPVIKYIHKKDKNFFNVLLKKLKLKTFQQFESHIEDFFMTINLRSRGKKYIKNQKEFIKLSKEMYTPGRADNFKFKVNNLLIKKIIRDTYRWMYN